ncbi:MAG: hypothetical protein AB1714_16330 [Acidobacteriota bacterium]
MKSAAGFDKIVELEAVAPMKDGPLRRNRAGAPGPQAIGYGYGFR